MNSKIHISRNNLWIFPTFFLKILSNVDLSNEPTFGALRIFFAFSLRSLPIEAPSDFLHPPRIKLVTVQDRRLNGGLLGGYRHLCLGVGMPKGHFSESNSGTKKEPFFVIPNFFFHPAIAPNLLECLSWYLVHIWRILRETFFGF